MLTWKGPKISVVAASKLSGFSSSLQQQQQREMDEGHARLSNALVCLERQGKRRQEPQAAVNLAKGSLANCYK